MLLCSTVEQVRNYRAIQYQEHGPLLESHFNEHVLLTGVRKEHFLPRRKWQVELWFFERDLSKVPARNMLCILT